ncbi:MAG: hypothetical protein NXI10_07565 [bacterium]|nr:hypothetical protein [bacterium]
MKVKRRTLNELRQTKDVVYKVPGTSNGSSNYSVIEGYLRHMREEQRTSQVSLKNFLVYLERNDLQIVKS